MQNMGANILDYHSSKVEFRVFAFAKKGVALLPKSGESNESVIPMREEAPNIYSVSVRDRD